MNRPAVRWVVLTGAGLVGLATATTSAVTLYRLAQSVHIPGPASLPIALDVGAAVAAVAWITQTGPPRAWGRAIAIGALAGTLACNGVQHAIAAGLLQVELPLVLAVGSAIPAMLWCVAHLAALMTAAPSPPPAPVAPVADVASAVTRTPRPARTVAAVAQSAPVIPRPVQTIPPAQTPSSRRAAGLAWARDHWPCTGNAIALAAGVSRSEGDRIRARVKAEKVAAA